jgi:hypothetical protein
MKAYPREESLKRTPLKPLTTDDYVPMRSSDNPLVALAEQLGYRISSMGREPPSGHHVQRYRGETATITIYEDDLLKLTLHLIEYTKATACQEIL